MKTRPWPCSGREPIRQVGSNGRDTVETQFYAKACASAQVVARCKMVFFRRVLENPLAIVVALTGKALIQLGSPLRLSIFSVSHEVVV